MRHVTTIKDIARVLGISASTVSRALRNHPSIRRDTCESVQDMAKQMNYRPNAIALSLLHRRSKSVGIIIPQIIHHFFSCVISGAEHIAKEKGYRIVIFQSNEDYEQEVAICQSILNSHLDGVLISMSKTTSCSAHFKHLIREGMDVVFYDRICGDVPTDRVVVDDYQGAFSAVSHLIERGCRRIAHLSAPQSLIIGQKRQQGYVDALAQGGIALDRMLIKACDNQFDAIRVTRELMALPNPPDGIFAVNDLTAAGAMRAVHEMGLHVPNDIAICGFTDGLVSTLTNPTLTTVEQHGHQIGEEAMRLLIDRIENEGQERTTRTKVIKTNLVVRESTQRRKLANV